jgi:hypothetical protein
MKNAILQISMIGLLAARMLPNDVRGQGTISVNNANGGGTLTSTSFGLFFDVPGDPYSATPINVTVLGGPDANSLAPIVTLSGPNALVMSAPGRYSDPSGGIYTVAGVAAGQPAVLQVLAWRGSAPTFAAADIRQDVFWPWAGNLYLYPTLFTFVSPTGGAAPASLDGMPAMWRILDVPEPSSGALLLAGGLLVWLLRRRRK